MNRGHRPGLLSEPVSSSSSSASWIARVTDCSAAMRSAQSRPPALPNRRLRLQPAREHSRAGSPPAPLRSSIRNPNASVRAQPRVQTLLTDCAGFHRIASAELRTRVAVLVKPRFRRLRDAHPAAPVHNVGNRTGISRASASM